MPPELIVSDENMVEVADAEEFCAQLHPFPIVKDAGTVLDVLLFTILTLEQVAGAMSVAPEFTVRVPVVDPDTEVAIVTV
jgi:hypothetical protein